MSIRSRASYNHPGGLGPAMRLPAQRLFLHHSVTPANPGNAASVRQVASIGVSRFGRSSYSYANTLDGVLWQMQGDNVGVHTAGYNSSSLAVVLVGNYDHTQISNAQVNSVAWLHRYLRSNGRLVSGAPLLGHRDVGATACPGKTAYAALGRIRGLLGSLPAPPPASSCGSSGGSSGGGTPLLRRGSKGTQVRDWQRILNGAGLLPANGIDGDFGPQTEAATKASRDSSE
jgi:hypothetical protein